MPLKDLFSDLKEHLEHGAALRESHVPAIEELLVQREAEDADPLVVAARSLQVPSGTKQMLADLLRAVEADVKQVEQTAAQQAVAAAQEPAVPPAQDAPAQDEATAS